MASPKATGNIPSENTLSSPQLQYSEFMSLCLNSGFDFEFVQKLDSKYECSVCLLALRNPVQTVCGHRFCKDCIISWMNGANKECPIDKQPLSESSLFHDSCIEREILQLKVKCPNSSLGCRNQVDLRYIEDHLHACVYRPILCPNECSVTVLQKELEEHLTRQCLHRLTQCNACDTTYTYIQEQIHLTDCPYINVTCELCGKDVPRYGLAEHRNVACPSAEIACNFFEHGCHFKASRNEVAKHCEHSIEYHIQLLSAAYKKINTLVLDLYRNVGQVASGSFTRQPSLRSQLSQSSISECQTSPLSDRTLENSITGATGGFSYGMGNPFGSSLPLSEKPEWNINGEMRHAQQSVLESNQNRKLKDLKDELKAAKDSDSEHPNLEHMFKSLYNKYINLDQTVMEETIKIENLIRKINHIDCSLRALEFENNGKFCNGIFVWKIPNFSDICDQMQKKKKTFHSPPFYTSQFGYKFCLRSNLNLIANETAFTLYVHTMQSKNDDFLTWPFKGKISLAILDCKEGGNRQHFTEDMVVATPLEAFRRPLEFRSIRGYGFKDFIPLDQIFNPTPSYNYLKDNILYVKAVVIPE